MNPKVRNLDEDESFNVTWIVNASGANGTKYELDVFFNSSFGNGNVADNQTLNVTVCIGGCAVVDSTNPNVTINQPLNQTYTTNTIDFNVTAVDDDGMSDVYYTLNGGVDNISMSNLSTSPTGT